MINKKLNFCWLMFAMMSCTHGPVIGDRKLSRDEIPLFMKEIHKTHPHAEFYEKRSAKDIISYEAKYFIKDDEMSLTFDSNGKFLESESDIKFDSLPNNVKTKMIMKLQSEYEGFKILECEVRKTNKEELIDLEIRHESSPSGYWELTFTNDGEFQTREVEDYDVPFTHN